MDTKIKKIILNKKLKKHEKLSKILKYLFIDIANINQEKYYILGSYSLRDYRTINDLDINDEIYNDIVNKLHLYNDLIIKLRNNEKERHKFLSLNNKDMYLYLKNILNFLPYKKI